MQFKGGCSLNSNKSLGLFNSLCSYLYQEALKIYDRFIFVEFKSGIGAACSHLVYEYCIHS